MVKKGETSEQRSERILGELRARYPGANAFDVDGLGKHFACEVEPTSDHAEYDRAVEVIIETQPHRHLKSNQTYTVLSGALELHVDEEVIWLNSGESYTVEPNKVHWSRSDAECWVEEVSRPGWTREDHVPVSADSRDDEQ